MDATTVANHAQWHGAIDALQVDLYDPEAAHPAVDSEDFYRDCRGLLSVNGWMTVNLFGRDLRYLESLKKITAAFGEACVWSFKPTSAGNTVVLAFQIPRAFNIQVLQAQAQVIEARWSLPATKWLKELTPVHE
jgi:spermidine synthase